MTSVRLYVQGLLEESLPRVLGVLILSYLKEKEIHVRTWGTKQGKELGEFCYPHGIALSGSGEVIVADTSNHRIQVFSPEGKFLRVWGEPGDREGQFKLPFSVTSLSSGEIIVADTNNHRIQVFTSEGKFLRMWGKWGSEAGEFKNPYGVTVLSSPSGSEEILVVDTWNHRIQVFTLEGIFLRMWGAEQGGAGSGAGEFRYPYSASSLLSGEVIVVDANNYRMQVFSSEGKFLRIWGTHGKGRKQFNIPRGITFRPSSKEIFVVDKGNHRIHVFTLEGKSLRIWEAREFAYPANITILRTPFEEIAVVDAHNHCIRVFSTILD